MPEACPRCLMTFPAHVVVRATCGKEWRGANFDAAAAEGNAGAAVGELLGMRVRTTKELEAFLRRAFVRAHDLGGGAFEFHVGLRDPADAPRAGEVREAVARAVKASRNFALVE